MAQSSPTLQAFSLPPKHIFAWLSLLPLAAWLAKLVLDDYASFMSLGPGGTPKTPLGYLKICMLRCFVAHSPAGALRPPWATTENERPEPFFSLGQGLPTRNGVRPFIAGIAPQRQRSQVPDSNEIGHLGELLANFASDNPDTLQIGSSCFEKHNPALFLGPGRRSINASATQGSKRLAWAIPSTKLHNSDISVMNSTCGHPPEIAHMHEIDGSLHLVLHPLDAATIIKEGWGQRHPLAGTGGFVRDLFNGKFHKIFLGEGPREGWLPRGFVLIYAPRDQGEREVIKTIIKASAWWVGCINPQ